MKVQEIGINNIIPYEKNAKKHPDKQIDQIAISIKKFGWAQPLVIDKDGVVVIGHGRLEAAKRIGLETVPCVVIDDLSDEEIKMLRLADNKLNESDWDLDIVLDELEGLNFGELDLNWDITELKEPEEPVESFKEYDEDIETTNVCPKCGYEW